MNNLNYFDILKIIEKYKIRSYKINKDKSIDVKHDVDLSYFDGEKFELQFNEIFGKFICKNSKKLKSLKEFPRIVWGDLDCSNCEGKFSKESIKEIIDVKGKIIF